jgi:NAD(P)H-flavin reductase
VQRIRFAPESSFQFAAGQYVIAQHENGTQIPLSIASSPAALPEFEIHYRSTPGDPQAAAFDELLTRSSVNFSGPHGNVRCPESGTLLLVVGGTGSSTAFCLATHRADIQCSSQTQILWCADSSHDLYDLDDLAQLSQTSVHTAVDDRRTDTNQGLLWLRDNVDPVTSAHVILSGSPGFVYATTDVLLGLGFRKGQLQSDVYDYAPR